MKKTVFIAHPISGDVQGNIKKVLDICAHIHNRDVIPVVPYLACLQYLRDEVAEERELGIEASLEGFHRGYVDEVWLFGDHISAGMKREVTLALTLGIPVVPQTEGTKKDLDDLGKT